MDVVKYACSYSTFVHAAAGAAAGSTALTIFYPLDLVRTRLQVDKNETSQHTHRLLLNIAADEGILGWYSGWRPVITSQIASNFVYFYAYNLLKLVFVGEGGDKPTKDLLIAFIAGNINVILTAPLWVVNTRLRLQGVKLKTKQRASKPEFYRGIIDAIMKISRKEGVRALWSGTFSSMILCSNPAIVFMVYEALKRYAQHLFAKQDLAGIVYFLMGAVSKIVATFATYPIQLVQSQMRAGLARGIRHQRISGILFSIIRNEGLFSLFRGLEAKLLQTVLTAATMFLVYEKIVNYIFYITGVTSPLKHSR